MRRFLPALVGAALFPFSLLAQQATTPPSRPLLPLRYHSPSSRLIAAHCAIGCRLRNAISLPLPFVQQLQNLRRPG